MSNISFAWSILWPKKTTEKVYMILYGQQHFNRITLNLDLEHLKLKQLTSKHQNGVLVVAQVYRWFCDDKIDTFFWELNIVKLTLAIGII